MSLSEINYQSINQSKSINICTAYLGRMLLYKGGTPTKQTTNKPSICPQQTSPSGHGLDFSKAFNKVPHQRLLHKLRYYGVTDSALAWIGSFLSGRSQQVVVDGANVVTVPCTIRSPTGHSSGALALPPVHQ